MLGLLAALFVEACVGDATSPSLATILSPELAPQPALIPSAADGSALPINRIRAVTTDGTDGPVLDDTEVDVSPTAARWELLIDLPERSNTANVVVTVYLMNVAGDGTRAVQFSGRTEPFPIPPGGSATPDVPIVRGPLANLYTTSVTILQAPSTMSVGTQAILTATAVTSTETAPTVFWTSLDPEVLAVQGATATALSPGAARVVASAGAFADTVQIGVQSTGPATLLGFWHPQVGSLVSVALDPATSNLFLYQELGQQILEYTPGGIPVPPAVPLSALASNDIDLDFLTLPTIVGQTGVPSNSLLIVNGAVVPTKVTAVEKATGIALDSIVLPTNAGSSVGGAFHPARGTLFSVDWTTAVIGEYNLASGALVSSFTVRPTGPPSFDVSYGDVDLDVATGNLMVVSSSQNVIRVFTSTGAWVRDVDVASLGIQLLSGIAWDDSSRTAWVVSTNGGVYHVGGIL